MREGAQSKKSREGEGENNTRVNVWASFGLVSRVVTWLQANDSRFLSTTILTLKVTSHAKVLYRNTYIHSMYNDHNLKFRN